jgi:hypothetical protein
MARLVQGWVDRRRSEPTVTTIERQSDAPPTVDARRLVATEAEALLTRLERMTRLTLLDTTTPAAAVLPDALAAMDRSVRTAQRELRSCTRSFLDWLDEAGRRAHPAEVRRRFVLVRLRFTDLLTHFDTFADALTQRSEHATGVWLAGLDACADDALQVPLDGWDPPQVVCYLDRGAGAAIRRARTRLPGGGSNPVALIRVPRERMIGSGIAASLVHEVGHQAAALLCLVESLRAAVRAAGTARTGLDRVVWDLWQRWVSEIVADLWSVARVGVGATVGLLSVVSLPEAFVFRVAMDDPTVVQSSTTRSPLCERRSTWCTNCESNSLPVPVSPVISTDASVKWATPSSSRNRPRNAALEPTMRSRSAGDRSMRSMVRQRSMPATICPTLPGASHRMTSSAPAAINCHASVWRWRAR